MRNILIICSIILVSLYASNISAQATIGVKRAPIEGAILELSNSDGVVPSTKGLGLPRVNLTDRHQLTPMFEIDGAGYKNAVKETEDKNHVGLLVYNPGNFDVCDYTTMLPGAYVWTGQKWANLEGKEPEYEMGPTVQIFTYQEKDYYTRDFGRAGRWMTENLKAERYDESRSDGFPAPTATILYVPNMNAERDPAEYVMTKAYLDANERLYTWQAATGGKAGITGIGFINEPRDENQPKVQGICPSGWHLPSDYEFTLLEQEIIKSPEKYSNVTNIPQGVLPDTYTWRGTMHGFAMRSACQTFKGNNPLDLGDDVRGGSLRARYGGFDARLTGFTVVSPTPMHSAYFWTSSAVPSTSVYPTLNAIGRAIETRGVNKRGVSREDRKRQHMFSIRCVLDGSNDSAD